MFKKRIYRTFTTVFIFAIITVFIVSMHGENVAYAFAKNLNITQAEGTFELGPNISKMPINVTAGAGGHVTGIALSSSNTNVANIETTSTNTDTLNTNIIAVNPGTAIITITAHYDDTTTLSATRTVHVYGLQLSQDVVVLKPTGSATLSTSVIPADSGITIKSASWSTSDSNVASALDGKVTAGSIAGTATITEKATLSNSMIITRSFTVEVYQISVGNHKAALKVGQEDTPTVTINPSNGSIKDYVLTSGNSDVAKVEGGKIIAVAPGTTTITAQLSGHSDIYAQYPLTVYNINLSGNETVLYPGKQVMPSATILPSVNNSEEVTWSINPSTVAYIENGKIIAKAPGTAVVTAALKSHSEITASYTIGVYSVSLQNNVTKLYPGQVVKPSASVLPESTDVSSVSWWSSDTNIAVIQTDGSIKAVRSGQTTIRASLVGHPEVFSEYTVTVDKVNINSLVLSKLNNNDSPGLKLTVEINTSACGNGLKYQVWLDGANGWQMVKNYGTDADITANASTAATNFVFSVPTDSLTDDCFYKVHVRIKDAATGEVYDQKTQSNTIVDDQRMTVDTFTTNASVDGKCNVGDSITLTATGRNVASYLFTVGNGSSWSNIGTASTASSQVWKPTYPGNYTLKVTASDTNGKTRELTIPFVVNQAVDQNYSYPELSSVNIPDIAKKGEKLNITAIPGVSGDSLQYRFEIGESMRSLGALANSSTIPNMAEWTPRNTGIYYILSYVKNPNIPGYQDRIERYCKVTDGLTNIKLDSVDRTNTNSVVKLSDVQKTGITFTATGSGSDKLQYSFWRYDERGYRLVQDYSDNKVFSWTPTKPGVYTILVRVKGSNSGSYEDQKTFTYTVTDDSTKGIQINSISVNTTCQRMTNQVITVDAARNGSSDTMMYKFAVTNKDWGYRELQAFSTSNTCNWTPTKAGEYTIIAYVKDASSGSYEVTKSQTVKVEK